MVAVFHRSSANGENFQIKSQNFNLLARLKATFNNWETVVLGGRHFRSFVWGAEAVLTKWESNFRFSYLGRKEDSINLIYQDLMQLAEQIHDSDALILLNALGAEKDPNQSDYSHQFVIGYSYAFTGGLKTNFEIFFNLNPMTQNSRLRKFLLWEEFINLGKALPLPTDASFYRTQGRIISKNKALAEFSLGYNLNPLSTVDLFVILDFKGKSAFWGPQFSYNTSDEGTLVLGAWLYSLPGDIEQAEFQGSKAELFAFFRVHF
jgi:hypothetical protein